MNEWLFTTAQALHLSALAPALLCIMYLAVAGRMRPIVWVPLFYFLSLACASLVPLLVVMVKQVPDTTLLVLTMIQSFAPALSFLLIMQCLLGRMPPPVGWLVLALPLFGGAPFTYATVYFEELCLPDLRCFDSTEIWALYMVFGSAVVFLLAMVEISRHRGKVQGGRVERHYKYWLVIALVLMNLVLLSLKLYQLAFPLALSQVELSTAVARVGFVYLVLTSVFRVFTGEFGQSNSRSRKGLERQEALAHELEQLMLNEKLYLEPGLSRAACAELLEISEAALSRVVKNHFRKTFTEWVNGFRTEEAKHRLLNEDTPVTTIAFEVGYNSIPTFNRVFKQSTGQSPSEYRESA